jgi:hypothetical protein
MNFSSNFSHHQKKLREHFYSNEYEALDKINGSHYEDFPNVSLRNDYDQIVSPEKKYLTLFFY